METLQFDGSSESVDKIVDFIEGDEWELEYQVRGPRGMFSGYELDIIGRLWGGYIRQDEWLIKRKGQITKLSDKDYQILFGEDD